MPNSQQAMKLRGNDLYDNGTPGVATCWYKTEFDGDFNIAQVIVSSRVASGTPGEYMVQVAVTDEIGMDTVNKAYVPMRAGVAYNDLSANGWQNATFSGAASKAVPLLPTNEYSYNVASIITDPLPLASIPRADGKPGGILLVKITQIDPNGGHTAENGNATLWESARGNPWFREFRTCKRAGINGIANLTALPTGTSTGYAFSACPVVTSTNDTKKTELVLFTGDSRRSAARTTFGFNNPNRMAVMGLSTTAHPFSIVNAAGSGHNQVQYLQVALDALTTGLKPTVIYLAGFSQNGFTTFDAFKARNDSFMASARSLAPGVKFVIDTDYFVSGYAGTQEQGRQQCIAYAKSLHNGVDVFCFDNDAIITDYSTPGAPAVKAEYLVGGDALHVGPAGHNANTYGDGTRPGVIDTYRTAFGLTTPSTPEAGSDMPTLQKIPDFAEQVLRGVHNFGLHVFKAVLTNTAPAAANTVLANITQVAATGGYVAGGYALDSITVTRAMEDVKIVVNDAVQTVNVSVARVKIADEVITATGGAIGPFRYAVVYNDTATGKPLIGYVDYGSSLTLADGEALTLDFDPTAGVLTLG